MPKADRTFHGAAGEHLVLGELLKRHIDAYLARGQTQQGWDILVVAPCSFKKVQVKAIDWPESTPVTVSSAMGFDAMVVVLLQRCEERSRFLVLTAKEVRRHRTPAGANRQDNNCTMTIPKDLRGFEHHEDCWGKLGAYPVRSA